MATPLDSATELARGVRVGSQLYDGRCSWRLGRLLGWSPLSSVWSARSTDSNGDMVIKVAKLGSDDAQLCAAREALALAHINHAVASTDGIHHPASFPLQLHSDDDASVPAESAAAVSPSQPAAKAHPHVVQLFGSFQHVTGRSQQAVHCLLLERLGNSLQQVMRRGHRGTPDSSIATLAETPWNCSEQASAVHAADSQQSGSQRMTPLPVDVVKQLTRDVLLALQHVHRCGWVQRDLKPGNIITSKRVLTERSNAANQPTDVGLHMGRLHAATWKLIDFGNAAYVGRTGSKRGSVGAGKRAGSAGAVVRGSASVSPHQLLQTAAYAPPEDMLGILPRQGADEESGQRTIGTPSRQAFSPAVPRHMHALVRGPAWAHPANDLWSLGCIVYEAATGYKLFDATRCRHMLLRADSDDHASPVHTHALHGMRLVWPWGGETRAEHVACKGGMPVTDIGDEELQLWHMLHVLGPMDVQALRRASSASATTLLDPEGCARLDHHPLAVTALRQAALAHTSAAGNAASPSLVLQAAQPHAGVAEAVAALLPLHQRLRVEAQHIPEQEITKLHDFLSHMLVYEPSQRPSAAQALQHPWVQDH